MALKVTMGLKGPVASRAIGRRTLVLETQTMTLRVSVVKVCLSALTLYTTDSTVTLGSTNLN